MKRRVAALLMAVVLCASSLPISAEEASSVTTVSEETADAGSEEAQEAAEEATQEEETPAENPSTEQTGATEEEASAGEEGKSEEVAEDAGAEEESSGDVAAEEETETTEELIEESVEASAEIPVLAEENESNGTNSTLPGAENGVITLLNDVELASPYVVYSGENITIDLAGYSITRGSDNTTSYLLGVASGGTLTIMDSSERSDGKIDGSTYVKDGTTYGGSGVLTNGSLIVESGTVSGYYGVLASGDSASVTVNGGTVSGYYGIYVIGSSASAIVTGGTVTGSNETYGSYAIGIYLYSGTAKITGGTVSGYYMGVYVRSGSLEMSGGNISATTDYGIYQANGSVEISGGEISGSWGVAKVGGTLEVSGGNIVGTRIGIFSSAGTVDITSGAVSTTGDTSSTNYAIYLSGGTLNASGGTINAAPVASTNDVWFFGIAVAGNSSQVTVNLSGNVEVTALDSESVTGYGAAVALWNATKDPSTPTTLNVSGKAVLSGSVYGITGNGGESGTYYTDINISGGTITGEWGIYHPQIGTLTISGGTITGSSTGIEIRSGVLNVSGGTITGNGTELTINSNGSGATTSGAGIAISQHTTTNVVTVNITGGTISGYVAVSEANPQKNDSEDVESISITITGGTLTSTNQSEDASALSIDDMGTISTTITGGTYNTDVDDYIDPGYKLVKNTKTGIYSIAVQTASGAVASITRNGTTTYYTPLSDAIEAAGTTSTTIKLLANVTENITIESGQKITLDLGKYTLTNDGQDVTLKDGSAEYCDTISNYGTLTITGSGKIDNVTNARGALVNYPGGTVTIKGGTLTRSQETTLGDNSWYTIKNMGTITITDGATVTTGSKSEGGSSLIDNGWVDGSATSSDNASVNDRYIVREGTQTANLTITGGTFIGGMNTVKNDDYGVLDISGGSFSNTTGAIILNWNVAMISGGTFTLTKADAAVLNNGYLSDDGDAGTMTITGGTFIHTSNGYLFGWGVGAKANSGTVTITGGSFTGSMNNSASVPFTVAISGGSFSEVVPEKFCATGYAPATLDTSTGMYTVEIADNVVARILDASGNKLNAYTSLTDAINVVTAGQTIELQKDVELNADITIETGKSFTLDLNGSSLTDSVTLTNNGTLTITGSGTIGTAVTNNGTLTIENSTFTNTVTNASGATMIITGGTFEGVLSNAETLTITDGTFAAGIKNGGTMTISDGSVTSSIANSGTLAISGGTVKSSSEAAIVNSGTLEISGGVLSGKDSCIQIASASASVKVSGGTLTGSVIFAAGSGVTGIANNGSEITGGYFNGKLYDTTDDTSGIATMLKESIKYSENGDLHFTDFPAKACLADSTAYVSSIVTVDGVTYCYTVMAAGSGLTATLKQSADENPNEDELTVYLADLEKPYTGSAIKPEPLITTEEGLALQKGTDYTLSYKNNVNVASYDDAKAPTIIIKGVGNYSGLYQEIYFSIVKKSLKDEDVTSYVANVTASSGVLKKSAPTLTYNNKTLRANTDYTLDYDFDVVSTGFKVTVTAYGKGNYTGKLEDTYYVFSARQNLTTLYSNRNDEDATISLAISDIESYTYDGTAKKPEPTLTLTVWDSKGESEEITLIKNKDYTVGYRNNVNAAQSDIGTKAPTIVITGKGCYSGSVTLYFTIEQADLTDTDSTLYTYIKNPTAEITNVSKLTTTVKLNAKTLRRNTDYTVVFTDGDYSAHEVTITGKGNYTDTITGVTYSVGRADLSTVTVSSIASVTYDTTAQKPEPVLKDGDYTLVKGVDYTVGYRNNVNAGSYASNGTKAPTVVITGIGNYKGTLTKYFTIKPRTLSEENSDFSFTVSDVKEGRKLTTSALVVKYKNRVLRQNTTTTYKAVIGESDLLTTTTITATGQGNYTGSVTVNVHRYMTELSTLTVVVAPAYYTGSALEPAVVVYNRAGEKLTEGMDYEIAYSNNIKVGWGTVTVKGCDGSDYGGNAKTVRFTIGARSILDVLKSIAQKTS
ncbi:MAG: hypothetical protein LUE31_08090 [Lachnospiraceae bacterium]|nr:hypothetical protein [Lachnospiraceae bacterium]